MSSLLPVPQTRSFNLFSYPGFATIVRLSALLDQSLQACDPRSSQLYPMQLPRWATGGAAVFQTSALAIRLHVSPMRGEGA